MKHRRTKCRRARAEAGGTILIAAVVLASCGGRSAPELPTTTTPIVSAPATTAVAPSETSSTTGAVPTTLAPSTTAAPTTTTSTTTTTTEIPTTTTAPPPAPVTAAGTYDGALLEIHLTFSSEVDDVTSSELEDAAMAILTDPAGWGTAGFTFVVDTGSDLTVVLAEPNRVDELCLPLDTGGYASCQNGPVVALNAQRWRSATDDWDSSIAEYRRYLVNHEVGHLLGLRHPVERCPEGETVSAVMEPQTAGLDRCAGNGLPLDWEHEWASTRPAVIAPLPEWDGPRPEWP